VMAAAPTGARYSGSRLMAFMPRLLHSSGPTVPLPCHN
jgi:hypothetical protein